MSCTSLLECVDGEFCISLFDNVINMSVCGVFVDCNEVVDDKNVACGVDEVCMVDGCVVVVDCFGEEDLVVFCVSEFGFGEGEFVSCVDGVCV